MKRILILAIVLTTGMVGIAQASHGDVGLGIQAGIDIPTGLTAKFWLDQTSAIDAAVGWNLIHDRISMSAGYLYHFPLSVRSGDLFVYVGVGGILGIWGDDSRDNGDLRLSGRIPVGLEFIYDPISFYGELDPIIDLIPATDIDIGGGIGFRFYF
jgi:hypothetical protein